MRKKKCDYIQCSPEESHHAQRFMDRNKSPERPKAATDEIENRMPGSIEIDDYYLNALSSKKFALFLFIILMLAGSVIPEHYSGPIGNYIVAILIICFSAFLLFTISDWPEMKNSIRILKDSVRAFTRFPTLVIPLAFTWSIYAPITLYLQFFMVWSRYSNWEAFLLVFGIIFLYSFLISTSCLVMLELLQQQESGRPMNAIGALMVVIPRDVPRAFPVMIFWAIIWFVLSVLEAIFSRKREGEEEASKWTPENAAKALFGLDSYALSESFFKALEKGIRMVVFLILPAIAWENLSTGKAMKKGIGVAGTHKMEFAAGYIMTEFAFCVLFLAPAMLFYISDKLDVHFSDIVWFITIIYIGLAWSYYLFLEQMSMAGLYLWHLSWERECATARAENRSLPTFAEVRRPILLDDVPDLSSTDNKK